jgi:hypothetical protein
VQRAREQNRANLLIANYYTQASMMQFYLPDHPVTYLPPAPYGTSQFTLWPDYVISDATRALYVVNERPLLSEIVKDKFKQWRLIEDFWSQYNGRPTEHFFIFFLWND